MSTRNENIRYTTYLNDKEVGKTINALYNHSRKLKNEIRRLEIGSEAWVAKMKELDDVNKQMKPLNDRLRGTESNITKLKNTAKSLLPAFSIGAIVTGLATLGKKLLQTATTMELVDKRARIVFGDSFGQIEKTADRVAAKMGLTNNEFINAATNTGDLLVPLDFTREKAANLSIELQSLAGALDEWSGGQLGAVEVSNILTKAMLGENEQLKQLGVAIRKDSEEFRDLVKIKMQDETMTKAQAEALTTLELIQKKTADAQTAYISGGSQLLRTQKSLILGLKERKEQLAGLLIPQEKSRDLVKQEYMAVNTLVQQLTDTNTKQEDRVRIFNQLKAIAPDIVEGMNAENIAYDKLNSNLARYNSLLIRKMALADLEDQVADQRVKVAERMSQRIHWENEGMEDMIELRARLAEAADNTDYTDAQREAAAAYGAELDRIMSSSDDVAMKMERSFLLLADGIDQNGERLVGMGDAFDDVKLYASDYYGTLLRDAAGIREHFRLENEELAELTQVTNEYTDAQERLFGVGENTTTTTTTPTGGGSPTLTGEKVGSGAMGPFNLTPDDWAKMEENRLKMIDQMNQFQFEVQQIGRTSKEQDLAETEQYYSDLTSQAQYFYENGLLGEMEYKELLINLETLFEQDKAAIREHYDKQQRERTAASVEFQKQMYEKAAIGTINTFSNMVGAISSLYSEQSEEAKGMAAFTTTLNAIASAVSAYNSAAQIPIVGSILAPIAAASALIYGFAQVKKIYSTKTPTFSAGDGYEMGGPTASYPHQAAMSEAGSEYVIPNWLRGDPQVAAYEDVIEAKRITGPASITNISNSSTVASSGTDPAMAAALEKNNELLERLNRDGVKGVWEWDNYKEGRDEMEQIEEEAKIT